MKFSKKIHRIQTSMTLAVDAKAKKLISLPTKLSKLELQPLKKM